MKSRCVIKVILASFFIFSSSFLSAQTLKEAITKTVQTNPDILMNIKNWLASEQGIKGARGRYLPTVDLIAEYGRERSENSSTGHDPVNLTQRGFGVSLRQMLFDGFGTSYELSRNKNRTIADVYQTQGIADDVALLTVKAYLDVLRTGRIVTLAQRNYKQHQAIYAMIKRRAEAGLGREADISQAYGRLALAKANLLAIQSNHRDARTVYNKIVGEMPYQLIMPRGPVAVDLPQSEIEAIRTALDSHPTFKAAKADVEEARAQHGAALSMNYPRIDAVLSASNYRDVNGVKGDDDEYKAMLELRYNLFRGGSDLARQNETAILINKAQEIKNRTSIQIVESMKLSWEALVTSRKQLVYFKKHRNASRVTVNNYQKQFTLGKRTLLDLLDAENEWFTSETDYVNGSYRVLFSKFRMLNSAGRILPYMGIVLPSPREKLNIVTSTWQPRVPPANLYKKESKRVYKKVALNKSEKVKKLVRAITTGHKKEMKGNVALQDKKIVTDKTVSKKTGKVEKTVKSPVNTVKKESNSPKKHGVEDIVKEDWQKVMTLLGSNKKAKV